jgi:hypothetical protein
MIDYTFLLPGKNDVIIQLVPERSAAVPETISTNFDGIYYRDQELQNHTRINI